MQILLGLEYLHSQDVIYRDLKPENVLLATDCTVKLCDLGDATWIDNGAAGRTSYVATRWYRAPELLVRSKAYGAAIDIWAVGCIAFEILTGEPLSPCVIALRGDVLCVHKGDPKEGKEPEMVEVRRRLRCRDCALPARRPAPAARGQLRS